jgi:fluoride exporter
VTFLAVALGGALGALLRWWLGEAVADGPGFPWTTFAINVSGSLALALLPALGAVRRRPALAAGLGPGLLGGYTTLSAYAEETRQLLASDELLTATAYVVGTLAACLLAVAVATLLSSPEARDEFAAERGDE